MKRYLALTTLFVYSVLAQVPSTATLKGTVTDPSSANVPGAVITVRASGSSQQATSDPNGQFAIRAVRPGKYTVRILAKGFAPFEVQDYDISGSSELNVQLSIATETQVLTVQEEISQVTTDPSSNAGAIVLREKELQALSDDPDELSQQLQALAGPGAGPDGAQIYIDGFTGANLPAKASIREVRINSNPFSPEYDRPGFGRIEILTKPGTDKIRGQAFYQFNNENLNTRSPLLSQSSLPPYKQQFFGFNVGGPIAKQKASYGFDFERRSIDENAFVLASTLDSNLNVHTVNQGIVTPQTRMNISPRIDYSINANNTLVLRYQHTRIGLDNEGIGNFSLASRAYNQTETENTLQLTETAVLGPRMINESRFQFMRTDLSKLGNSTTPAISVQGAFEGGGATVGNSSTLSNRWEFSNTSTFTRGKHTFKWGGRLRQAFTDDISASNFNGTYTFLGGTGPELDASNLPVAGTSIQVQALERYRRTLLFQSLGYSAEQIRLLGGGASYFSIATGSLASSVTQFDAGLFVSDDWRLLPNLTLSYGLRYETQTNIHDYRDLSPRLTIAWGIDGHGNKVAKTVLRAGFGVFYDRVSDSVTLQAARYNGTTQQSYLVQNPDFFPSIPSAAALAGSQQPQQLQSVDQNLVAPRNYQTNVGLDRQINKYARVSVNYISSRGVHLLRTRDINAPINGVYPFGDSQLRFLTESTGFSRSNQVFVAPNINYKKLFLFGSYALSYGKTDAEGQAADPYNVRAEWGPSSFADVRHRAVIGTSIPLPWKVSMSPFLTFSSGSPYNITTGRDLNGDGLVTERPALLTGVPAAACSGGNLLYETGFGCFDLNPTSGMQTISRNYARGPANFNVNLRLGRTWSFGNRGEASTNDGGPPPGMGGIRGGGGPPPGGGGPGGGGPPPGGGPGMFSAASSKKYNLTLSLNVRNLMNHANFAAPSGDLSSPYFGDYRSLAGFGPFGGNSTYNRKVDIQLRFTF